MTSAVTTMRWIAIMTCCIFDLLPERSAGVARLDAKSLARLLH
jgi:hypothetical protein